MITPLEAFIISCILFAMILIEIWSEVHNGKNTRRRKK